MSKSVACLVAFAAPLLAQTTWTVHPGAEHAVDVRGPLSKAPRYSARVMQTLKPSST